MREKNIPRPFSLHWGKGIISEEASCITPYHQPTIQLLEFEDGSSALRFCYYADGRFQRSPLIIGEEHLEMLREEIKASPKIEDLLRRLVL